MPTTTACCCCASFRKARCASANWKQALDIRQPTLSQQLGVLRSEGVVSTRREGKNIFYSVADAALLEILAVLYRLYCPKEKR